MTMNKAISVPKSAEVLPVTRSSTTIRELILSNDLSFLMEAHHGLSASAAERAGFKGLWASGLGGNSSFVSGTTMHNFLESTFGCVFRFGIYSDLLGYEEPNEAFFNKII
ncbi:hypothetical protein [Rhizobium laguerreae]|uniref:hypothetical protein n=1 Tax=Rhizobium laguerreae TaxID=1076926 RepID=UPI003703E6CF